MALVVEQPIATFDLSEIARGDLVYGKHRTDRKSTRLNSSHRLESRMPSSA